MHLLAQTVSEGQEIRTHMEACICLLSAFQSLLVLIVISWLCMFCVSRGQLSGAFRVVLSVFS